MISGKTDPDERARLVRDFRKGRYQFLWNCAIATEGFDAPGVSCIAIGRPTKSRALLAQMAGRGTRVLPGVVDELAFADGREDHAIRREAIARSKKPDLMLIDFVGNSDRHELACPEDLLGGDYTVEEKRAAKKRIKEGGGGNVKEALEASRRELKRIAEAQKSMVKARVERFDPFKLVGFDGADKYALRAGHKPILPADRERLVELGYPRNAVDGLDREGGKRLLKQAHERSRKGLASMRQLSWLSDFGINDPNLRKDRATRGLDYVQDRRNRRMPVDVKKLNEILYGLRQPGQEG